MKKIKLQHNPATTDSLSAFITSPSITEEEAGRLYTSREWLVVYRTSENAPLSTLRTKGATEEEARRCARGYIPRTATITDIHPTPSRMNLAYAGYLDEQERARTRGESATVTPQQPMTYKRLLRTCGRTFPVTITRCSGIYTATVSFDHLGKHYDHTTGYHATQKSVEVAARRFIYNVCNGRQTGKESVISTEKQPTNNGK